MESVVNGNPSGAALFDAASWLLSTDQGVHLDWTYVKDQVIVVFGPVPTPSSTALLTFEDGKTDLFCSFGADLGHGIAYAATAFSQDRALDTLEILGPDGAVLGSADFRTILEKQSTIFAEADPPPPPGIGFTLGVTITVASKAFED